MCAFLDRCKMKEAVICLFVIVCLFVKRATRRGSAHYWIGAKCKMQEAPALQELVVSTAFNLSEQASPAHIYVFAFKALIWEYLVGSAKSFCL